MRKTIYIMWAVIVLLIAAVVIAGCKKGEKEDVNRTADIVSVQSGTVGNSDPGAGVLQQRPATTEVTTHEEETTTEPATSPAPVVDPVEPETETEVRSAEELADYVLDNGLDGPDREAYLGDRYDEVQAVIDERYSSYEPYTYVYTDVYDGSEEVWTYQPDTGYYYDDSALSADSGINYHNGVLETYYNMDMGPWLDYIYDCGYEGEYWVRSDGVKMFGDYVIVAADYGYEPMGTIVETSLGTGMVLDTGLGGYGWHDIAVNW